MSVSELCKRVRTCVCMYAGVCCVDPRPLHHGPNPAPRVVNLPSLSNIIKSTLLSTSRISIDDASLPLSAPETQCGRLQMEKQRLTPLPIKFVCFSVNKVDFHLRFAAKGRALHLREILDR